MANNLEALQHLRAESLSVDVGGTNFDLHRPNPAAMKEVQEAQRAAAVESAKTKVADKSPEELAAGVDRFEAVLAKAVAAVTDLQPDDAAALTQIALGEGSDLPRTAAQWCGVLRVYRAIEMEYRDLSDADIRAAVQAEQSRAEGADPRPT